MNQTAVSAKRLTVIWIVLLAATALSWTLGHGVMFLSPRHAGIAIVLLAFLKIRFVTLEFMELRRAPMLIRLVCEFWVIIMCGGILWLYRT